ncbi:hypothetical protein [Chromobacterium violaceum]|uniref:hypothetical protein n=1 Tax=Chromobacterium violaceum TaxID=536 RepID=UPI000E1827E8|nr:hypothetical protein [Chromobacterium violaceum]MBA8736979.1 hypothetical protein [Chromobacterium violaceum]MBP4051261.1 hypothetical protein [Chromobacterium violaceum]SUX40417.1 Uncharacterised protein [Chromobacterium violaceum]
MSKIASEVRSVRAYKAMLQGEGALSDEQVLEILQAQRQMLDLITRKWRADAKKRQTSGGAAGSVDSYRAMAEMLEALDRLAQACGAVEPKKANPPPATGVSRTANGKDKL